MIDTFREFIILASCRSFAKAAEELHTTQSTLSRHIAELERYLGFKLFERNPLTLTEAGNHCLQAIIPVVNAYDKAIQESREFADQPCEQLSVSLLPCSSEQAEIIYGAFARLRQSHSNLTLKIIADNSVDAYSSVVLGVADVAFLASQPESIPEGFTCEPFGIFNIELWGHRKGGLYKNQPVKTEDLKDYALVASTNKVFSAWFDMQVDVLRRLGLTLPIHIRELNTLNEFALTLKPDEIMITQAGNDDPSAHINPDLQLLEWDVANPQSTYCVFYAQGPRAHLAHELAIICREITYTKGLG